MAAPMNMWNFEKTLLNYILRDFFQQFTHLSYQTRIVIDMIGLASQDILYLVYLLNSWNCEIPYIEHMLCLLWQSRVTRRLHQTLDMSNSKLINPKKKRRVFATKESPFPVPIASITGEPPSETQWMYYTGNLVGNQVIVHHSGDISFLYKMVSFCGNSFAWRLGVCLL